MCVRMCVCVCVCVCVYIYIILIRNIKNESKVLLHVYTHIGSNKYYFINTVVSHFVGFNCRRGLTVGLFFSLRHRLRTGFGGHSAYCTIGTGALILRLKRQGREADHSPPSSAEVKNAWSYTSTPPIRLHGVVLS
jgi:hypothetical protein